MQIRPLADRVEGVDAVLRVAAPAAGVAVDEAALLRVAAGMFVARHGVVMDAFADGTEPVFLVADGLLGSWPDDGVVENGWPLHGVELIPIAEAIIDELSATTPAGDRLAGSAGAAAAWIGDQSLPSEDFAVEVTREILESLVLAAMTPR